MGLKKDYTNSFAIRLSNYLKEVEVEIINRWFNSIKISKHDPFYKEIIQNGKNSLHLINHYIETRDIEPIIALTRKIARERIGANINISEFVHNINNGRSVVCEIVSEADSLSKDDKLLGIMIINKMVDTYLYYAIKEYTNLKDSIILEKNQFIKEMHNDRLTILGQIAASFAHEFRNPLTSIKGFIKLLEKKYQTDSESSLYFDIINHEMECLQDNVSRFLFLSKSKGLDDEMKIFNLSDVTSKMIEFMYPRFVDENIEVHKYFQGNCMIMAVEEQIKQILLNIFNNAVEELTEAVSKRFIEIDLRGIENTVVLKITNNGKMIPAHLLENIFEPFVTTKDLGTGLGLSVVKQIVEKHEGTISVESNENNTTFTIIFRK